MIFNSIIWNLEFVHCIFFSPPLFVLILYSTYILYSQEHDCYYVGQTNNMANRILRHNSGYESYTKKYRPWKLVCVIEKSTRKESLVLEKKLKNLSRVRLQSFILKYGNEPWCREPWRCAAGQDADKPLASSAFKSRHPDCARRSFNEGGLFFYN